MAQTLAKRVSNYELFFDLAIVLAIGQLTESIHLSHIGVYEILSFIVTNIILFNVWINEVLYFNRYGDSRVHDIYTVSALMFVLGNIALNFNMDFKSYSTGNLNEKIFNTLLISSYAIIILQYYFKGKKVGFTKDIKISLLVPTIYIATLLPLAFGIIPVNILTIVIYLLPNIIPLFFRKQYDVQLVNFPHALERLQLVTILTFGEAVIGIISTYPITSNLLLGPLFFFGMASLFIFYMGQTFLNIDHHRNTPPSVLFYAHLPIFIGINIFTVGVEFLADHHHASIGFFLFFAGIISFYLGVLATSPYNQKIYQLTKSVWVKYSLVIILGLGAMILFRESLLLLAITLIILNFTMMQISILSRRRARERHNIAHPDSRHNPRDFKK